MDIRKNNDFIIGKSILQIRFNRYSIDFIIEDEILIQIGSSLIYTDKNGMIQSWSYISNDSISLNLLLEKVIEKVYIDSVNNLTLKFMTGESVVIEAHQDDNESYVIHNKKDFQVIC